jgi:hypothetical protein
MASKLQHQRRELNLECVDFRKSIKWTANLKTVARYSASGRIQRRATGRRREMISESTEYAQPMDVKSSKALCFRGR